jgi:hypothetical protein
VPKKADYERAGVLEYVVRAIDPDEIFWFGQEQGVLVQRPIGEDGVRVHGPRATGVQIRATCGSIKADLAALEPEATPEDASVSSDRSAQRGSRFVGQGEDFNREGTPFAGSVGRFLRRSVHSAMRGPGACFEIPEQPPATPSNISDRMSRDVRIRYSTVGVVPSSNSADPSSGRLWR